MLRKPNKEWIGTYHRVFGKLEDKQYEIPKEYENEPMFIGGTDTPGFKEKLKKRDDK